MITTTAISISRFYCTCSNANIYTTAHVYQQSRLPNYTVPHDHSRILQRMPPYQHQQQSPVVVVMPTTNFCEEKERNTYATRHAKSYAQSEHMRTKEKPQRKEKRPKKETIVSRDTGRKSVTTYEKVGAIKEYPLYPATRKHAAKRDTETREEGANRKKKSKSTEPVSNNRDLRKKRQRQGD